MADCNETLRELFVFLDDELTAEAHDEISAHLSDCTDCQGAFEFHAELKAVVSAKCRSDEMPPGLMAKIEQCFGESLTSGDDTPVA
jgi:mycothiol system anti-sigma-R factor